MVDELNGQRPLFKSTDRQDVIGQLAARVEAGTLTANDVRKAQRFLAYCAWDDTAIGSFDESRRHALRAAALALFKDLPRLEGDLRSWLIDARRALHEIALTLTTDLKHTGGPTVTAGALLADHQAAEVFSPPPRVLEARTVHSFKGRR
jgi:hypothetical protein